MSSGFLFGPNNYLSLGNWRPLVTDTVLRQKIEQTIEKIRNSLSANHKYNGIGLLNGKTGELLFTYYYYKATPDPKILDQVLQLLNDIFDALENAEMELVSFANGLAGIAWAINHIARDGIIEIDPEQILPELDLLLHRKMEAELKEGHYDYLHGGGGIGLYLLNRVSSPYHEKYAQDFLGQLLKSAGYDKDTGHLRWNDYDHTKGVVLDHIFNLGLAHGMPGIILLLLKIADPVISPEIRNSYIQGITTFLLSNRNTSGNFLSQFSYHVNENDKEGSFKETRLGWCYGDLGVAYSILKAGKTLKNDNYQDQAIDILLRTSQRRALRENMVMDASLCHGTAGIAHMFNRLNQESGLKVFNSTALYWFKETLRMDRFDQGAAANFKSWNGGTKSMEDDFGLLTGIAGIGLALLSAISEVDPGWDECLLLS